MAVRDRTTVRCGILDTNDARRLSESLDALALKMHDEEPLYTTDLTSRVFIYIATGYPREPDCAAAGRNVETLPDPPTAFPTPGPDDDLAGVDPCSLLPASVDAMFGSGVMREARPSTLAERHPGQVEQRHRTRGIRPQQAARRPDALSPERRRRVRGGAGAVRLRRRAR